MIEKLLKLANNEDMADSLIKTTYPEEILQNLNSSLSEQIEDMPPECIRISENKEAVYFIYKSDTGRYAFWMYFLNMNTGKVTIEWYSGKSIHLENFEKMKENNATFEDVKEYDPYGSYISLYMGSSTSLYTYHYTVDGYMLRLDYSADTDTISKITKYSGEDNPLYDNLLPMDRVLLN